LRTDSTGAKAWLSQVTLPDATKQRLLKTP
jgi:hypothetical protein